MELFFDTETSGFVNKGLPANHPKQSWIMQLAFILSDERRIYSEFNMLIIANDRFCHPGAQSVHKISTEDCNHGGMPESYVAHLFQDMFAHSQLQTIVAHNISFDLGFVGQMMERNDLTETAKVIKNFSNFCTMKSSTDLCKLPGKFGKYKWPKLIELYKFLFNEDLKGAHDALADVRATRRCYYKLKEIL